MKICIPTRARFTKDWIAIRQIAITANSRSGPGWNFGFMIDSSQIRGDIVPLPARASLAFITIHSVAYHIDTKPMELRGGKGGVGIGRAEFPVLKVSVPLT
jgi:hypothetical protein